MALAADQVIDAIAALLSGATDAGTSVHTNHPHPLPETALPAWRVDAEDEDEEIVSGISYPARQQHELTVNARGIVRDVDGMRAARGQMGIDALGALFASRNTTRLAPLNCSMALARIRRDSTTEGEAAVGQITLALRVRFHTFNNAPETVN